MNRRLLYSCLGVVSFIAYRCIKNYLQCDKRIKQIQAEKISTIKDVDIYQVNQHKILKIYNEKLYGIEFKTQMGFNQRFYNDYQISKIIQSQVNSINQNQQQNQFTWKMSQYNKLLSFPKIQNKDVFEMTFSYKQNQRSILQSLFVGFFTVFSFGFDFLLKILFRQEYLYFAGPTVGTLTNVLKLVTDRPLIAECIINDGTITPILIGLTKSDIVQYYSNLKNWNSLIICGALVIILLSKSLIKHQYFLFKENFGKFFKEKDKLRNLLKASVNDDLCCIICYAKCRNVIFKVCKHLSICSECLKNPDGSNIDRCPLCRLQIRDQFILIENYQQPKK